jgi:hypothetical protein
MPIVGGAVARTGGNPYTVLLPSLNLKVTLNGGAAPASTTVRVLTACNTQITGLGLKASDGTLTNPGMPYGTGFKVCATDGAGNRGVLNNVANQTYAQPLATTPATLNMTGSGAACPF